MYKIQIEPKTLMFKTPAGTSRGVYNTRKTWLVKMFHADDNSICGIGEAAPLPNLSMEYTDNYEENLHRYCRLFEQQGTDLLQSDDIRQYSSILFALETAYRHLQTSSFALWNTAFSRGEVGIPMNGLIWMGEQDYMLSQIERKIADGYKCIKIKIGAIDFEKEMSLLATIRDRYSKEEIEIRVDANGAFSVDEVMNKLDAISRYDVHSIEQPIRAGQLSALRNIVSKSPIPIALDEELIGVCNYSDKQNLIHYVRPHYIILKPSLHGGFSGCDEWIQLASEASVGWWATSALESNIGLNSIANWCATKETSIPQGLGTGQLFVENIYAPIEVRNCKVWQIV